MPRKKKVEVAPEVEVKEEAIVTPEKIKVTDFIDKIRSATKDEIKDYIKDNNILYRDFIPYNDLVIAARHIIDDSCYDVVRDEDGDVISREWIGVNSADLKINTSVYSVVLYLDLDYETLSFGYFYDVIREYNLDNIVKQLIAEKRGFDTCWEDSGYIDIEDLVYEMLDDIKYNDISVDASMRRIAATVEDFVKSMKDGVNDAVFSTEVMKDVTDKILSNTK